MLIHRMKRTQIYLDEDHAGRLDEHAARQGTTRSQVIREAIDAFLEDPDGLEWERRWKGAVRASAGVAPDLPTGANYVDRLRATGAHKLDQLELRRRR